MAYELGFVGSPEAKLAARLVAEQYRFSYPKMTYRVVDATQSLVDPDYGDAKRSARVYTDYPMWLHPVYRPEEMGLSAFGIDRTRQIIFFGSTHLFDSLGITPKFGDVIMWELDPYEVQTFKPKEDSEIAKTNFFTEMELVANIPAPDQRGVR